MVERVRFCRLAGGWAAAASAGIVFDLHTPRRNEWPRGLSNDDHYANYNSTSPHLHLRMPQAGFAASRARRHPKASPCNSTPATDGRRIVALFGSEGLFCFDTAGKLVWQKDLGPMDSGFYLVPSAQWGFGSSPIIAEGKVIVLCD
jgi:outer membrane protein assembly factor BamB